MVCQLRIYTINRGMMDSWTDLFNLHIRPLHDRLGIPVVNSWVNAEDNEFIWVRRFNDREEIAGKEAEYFASPERVALGDRPTSHIAKMRVRVMDEVEGVQASGGLGRVFQQAPDDDPGAVNIYDPTDPAQIARWRATHWSDQKDYRRAIPYRKHAIDLRHQEGHPDDPRDYYFLGEAHFHLGEYDDAIADCDQAISLNPDYSAAYEIRGRAYDAKGMHEQAETDFQKARGLDNEVGGAIPNFDRYPERPTDHFGLGLAHLKNADYGEPGFYREAIENFSRAIELDPKFADAYKRRGDAYSGLAEEEAESDYYNRAIADYNRAIALNPDDASAYSGRGYAFYRQDNFDRAIADFTQAIDLNPGNIGAYGFRGYAFYRQDNFDRAIADFTQVIVLDPDIASAYQDRGDAYFQQGEYKLAIADFTQAIDRYPDFEPNPVESEIASASIYYNRGLAHRQLGNETQAAADLKRAAELDPNLGNP